MVWDSPWVPTRSWEGYMERKASIKRRQNFCLFSVSYVRLQWMFLENGKNRVELCTSRGLLQGEPQRMACHITMQWMTVQSPLPISLCVSSPPWSVQERWQAPGPAWPHLILRMQHSNLLIAESPPPWRHRQTASSTRSTCHFEKIKPQTYLYHKDITTRTNHILLIFHCVFECNLFSFLYFKGKLLEIWWLE